MSVSDSRRSGYWMIAFAAATFLSLILAAHSYIVYRYNAQISEWGSQFARTISGWYLWAALFPFIFNLARRYRFGAGTRLKSITIHTIAGAGIAIVHASLQILINDWLLHPDRTWSAIQPIVESQFLTSLIWRFVVYQAILCVSIALDSHQRAREIEIQASQMENSILESKIESLKTQLDPDFLFQSLRELSRLMRRNFDQAESLVARLGAYLRMRLDQSGTPETTLREEVEFLKCYLEIESIKRGSNADVVFDLDQDTLDCGLPGMILQSATEDAIARRTPWQALTLQIQARKSDGMLTLVIRDSMLFRNAENPKLQKLITRFSELNRSRINLQQGSNSEGAFARIDIPLIPEAWTLEKDDAPIDVTEVEPAGLQNPVRKWLVIICVFTALALFFTIQKVIVYASRGASINWAQHLLDYSGWYIWALITPVVLKISSKYPLQRQEWWKYAAVHFVAFVASWVVATLAMDVVKWGANLGSYNYFAALPASFARSPITLDVLCYSAIVAVESALRYRRRYEAGTVRTLRLGAQLSRAKLDALKMQLHPHFLFNSLNSLSELMQEDPGAAEEMIRNLEMFLQLTVHQNHLQEIPFGKEMEFLRCYLAIENVRYQDRLNVTMDIEPQAMEVPVPNLLLQPIVENAIRHGIAPRSTPGHIDIQAKRNNGVLALQVRDNGPGLSKSTLKSASFRSGLGLSNTRERLTQLYGNRHRFELVNAPEGGLIVSVEIPVRNDRKR